jgi:hypothetical protein
LLFLETAAFSGALSMRRCSSAPLRGAFDHRTDGHLKVSLLFLETAAFSGALACGIVHLHRFAVRLLIALSDT